MADTAKIDRDFFRRRKVRRRHTNSSPAPPQPRPREHSSGVSIKSLEERHKGLNRKKLRSLMQVLDMRQEARARARQGVSVPEVPAASRSLAERGRQWIEEHRESFPTDLEGQVRKHFELRKHTTAVRTGNLPRFVVTEVGGKEVSREPCPDPEQVVYRTLARFQAENREAEKKYEETPEQRRQNPFWRRMNRSAKRSKRLMAERKLREEAEAGVVAAMDERQREQH